ncbi:WD repeat-containing protein 44-like [Orbicella faveolata]|uniref:WD repeat-containing protein 44-like n=1 Tax=Orbicella faveolata TaxID=48498 RepID=UPI0009E1DA73|nr:WD repeat-containing protein 44-like [Orbicella faveolata]
MQSESDSDNEFFDAPEKLSLSGSFTSDLSAQHDVNIAQKDIVDGPPESGTIDTSSGDQPELPSEELNQSTASEVNKTNKTDIVKTCGESTALNNTADDLQEKQESGISSLANDSESKFVHENHATDSNSMFQAHSGESESKVSDADLKTDREIEVEQHHNCEKKTDLTMPKTDASQIIADVVESIEQESTPPVAPPRRRKRKKKAEGELQTPGSPTPSESPGPDSAVTTPTEQAAASPVEAFAQAAALSNEQENAPKELESQSNDIHEDDPSIHVDANNKEMKTVLEKASSTEVISALNLDSRLKSGSVVSLGSTRSGSYGSVASGISNGILENSAGSFTSVASSFSQHQPYGSHHGLVRYRSASGRPLSDIEILEQVMVKNLDTGEAVPLSVAEEKLPKCTNPLALQIMILTSEYSSNPDLANQDHEDGLERKVSKKTKKLKKFFGKKVKKPDKAAKVRKDDSSSSDEETPQDSHTPLIKIKSGHGKGPAEFEKLRILQDLSGEHVGAVWTIKFTLCGRLMATAGQDHMVRVWVLKESQSYFEEMRAKYSKTGDNSSSDRDKNSDEFSEMEGTLKSNEENTGDTVEDKTENSEDSEEPAAPVDEDLGPYMKTPLCTYCGHTGDVLDLSWSKNYFLLSSSMDKTVRLWHISRSECLCCFQHIDFVTAICFHPRDDRYFLSGSLDGKIRLWNIPDKKVALWNELEGTGSNLITAANFCLNGKFAVVGTYDGRCIFYETERLKYHTQWQVRAGRNKKARGRKISGIEPMPGEDKVLITSNDSRIRLYDLKDNSLNCKYKGCVNSSSQIKASFSHDGQYVICGSEDHFVYIWRTQHGFPSSRRDKNEFYESFSAHAVVVTAAMFAPVPWLIIPPDSSCQPFTTEVLVTADWSGAIKLFVNR